MNTIFWLVVALCLCVVAQVSHRHLLAMMGVVIVVLGFVSVGIGSKQPDYPFVAAKVGSREYHTSKCIDAEDISDPTPFNSREEAEEHGYTAHYCVLSHDISLGKEIPPRPRR